ncbi:hypothetical protein ABNG30_00015 [Bacillus thuringiensis]
MSIDADLNQRIISEKDAQVKRKKLNMETEFFTGRWMVPESSLKGTLFSGLSFYS